MPFVSMTGFARASGRGAGIECVWELRSVNGKGLDVRLRLPPGFEAVEGTARNRVQQALGRGNVNGTLSVTFDASESVPVVNQAALAHFAEVASQVIQDYPGIGPATADGLMALRGVIEPGGEVVDEEQIAARQSVILDVLGHALSALTQARRDEGERTSDVIEGMVAQIASLADDAAQVVEGQRAVLHARKVEAVQELLSASNEIDPLRLEQEVALLYTKADVREELDRLSTHVAQARELITAEEPIGRRFDFLCQELNREANTLCSKAAIGDLSKIGLDLKIVIDQLREQVQNIE